jgi:hypothetical protein
LFVRHFVRNFYMGDGSVQSQNSDLGIGKKGTTEVHPMLLSFLDYFPFLFYKMLFRKYGLCLCHPFHSFDLNGSASNIFVLDSVYPSCFLFISFSFDPRQYLSSGLWALGFGSVQVDSFILLFDPPVLSLFVFNNSASGFFH